MRTEASAEFDWWFRAAYPGVARTVFLIVYDRGRAEEITQDAFLQLLRQWNTVRDCEKPDAWVRRVAIRLAVRHVKRERMRAVREPLSIKMSDHPLPDPDLGRAVATLSPNPDLDGTFRRALDRLTTTPLTGRVDETAVYVDDAKLLRFARFALGGDGPNNLTYLPRILTRASAGQLDPELARWVAEDVGYCAGYRPLCGAPHEFALGVFLTDFCGHDVDEAALAAAVGKDAAYRQVFTDSPYRTAGAAWAVPVKPPPPTLRGINVLLLPGQFDSWSRPEWAQKRARRDAGLVYAVTIPWNTHNTLGVNECVLELRRAWREEPTKAPDTHSCDGLPQLQFR